jgi:hypothetical protein
MTLHTITELCTKWFNISPNVTSKFRATAIFKENNGLNNTCRSIYDISFYRSYMWTRKSIVMLTMPARENSWLVHQSSLPVLPAETCRSKYEEWMKEWEFCLSPSELRQRIFNMYNFTTWGLQLYFLSQGRCAAHFIALKNLTPRPGLNPRPLGPVKSTLITTPARRLRKGTQSTSEEGEFIPVTMRS